MSVNIQLLLFFFLILYHSPPNFTEFQVVHFSLTKDAYVRFIKRYKTCYTDQYIHTTKTAEV
ncbi:hypothetical protein GLYMA_11G123350v4 [Glycine max]|nr:hypothetical protein GLYMA_11G123350v4 [Glycine max]KAH1158805.1 hypothetical protein GYH30_030830 [Glycine max]